MSDTGSAASSLNAGPILLVDDNPTNLQVLYETLTEEGLRVLVANSGRTALEIARKAKPALILLDIIMPEMDGYETCRLLRADPKTAGIAVIFLSALRETKDRVKGLKLGAVDYVSKPFQAEEVIARVRTHVTIQSLREELESRNQSLEHKLEVAQALLRDAQLRVDAALMGESPAVRLLREEAASLAQTPEPVLLVGPPRSGP